MDKLQMNLALFDFDGTITTREMLPAFVYSAVPPQRLHIGKLRLAPWIAGYRFGWYRASSLHAVAIANDPVSNVCTL